jgi:glycosyltransferase involved in cell wall biosynthesis
MSAPIRISVITPSYNQGDYIGRTLASVERQSLPALEHLVYDGGSRDGTLRVLRESGPRVHWVSRPDGGQAEAVNQGLQACRGEVIGWINSDDIYYPEAFARVAAAFEADPELDVVYGEADHIDVHDQPFEAYPTLPWDPDLLRQICYICQPALFFRRRVVDRVGLLDAALHYCMDYNYWLRLADAGCRFAYIPCKLAGSRLYANTKTLYDRPAVHREIADMFLSYQGAVPLRWVYAYAHYSTIQEIDRQRQPLRYLIGLSIETMRSQWRWNHRLDLTVPLQVRRINRQLAQRPEAPSS